MPSRNATKLRRTKLRRTKLRRTKLRRTKLRRAKLPGVRRRRSRLQEQAGIFNESCAGESTALGKWPARKVRPTRKVLR
ncbi:pentapeptide repeat-containing protein [Rhodococcus sp. 1163]|uniref:pentapeptide repeat-containing protein n=1 Tax=Rhodococcus sp. 1163 TaxID=1905289 RepID=UPI00356B6F77